MFALRPEITTKVPNEINNNILLGLIMAGMVKFPAKTGLEKYLATNAKQNTKARFIQSNVIPISLSEIYTFSSRVFIEI